MTEHIDYKLSPPYRGYPGNMTDEEITKRFKQKFGVEPDLDNAIRYSHTVMVPEPQKEQEHD